jgi:hypothetical protein
MWRNLTEAGLERCELNEYADRSRELRGTVLVNRGGDPIEARYSILIGEDWHTRSAIVEIGGQEKKTITFSPDAGARWNVKALPADMEIVWDLAPGEHVVDIDLGFTPATNVLPICRLNLEVGQSHAVTACWLRYPELTIQILRQTYTRMESDRYLYQSPGFEAEVTVDEQGLPVDYIGYWERIRD